ncbi:hypothetical protein Goklo_013817 [Gossypium klotzschianum]|uniref:DUF4283 domain-containing protein n=1 Tax=Gossypium klotzschianum TaxID=34286 RepID=A0A7J8U5V8_9ROSI|nr:hypothetical protein [Gossypium klotzschianum]
MMPWLFDQCLFTILPFVKGQELDEYVFNITPFWIRIYNIPLEQRGRQVAINVGKTIEEVVAIDWRDRNGGWTDYISIRVKIDVLRPLRRVYFVGSERTETVCTIKKLEKWDRNTRTKKINLSEENNGNKAGNQDENELTTLKGK